MSLGCRIRRNFERPSKELVEAFRGIPVANIDDNCGRIAAVDSSIYPLNPKARLLGTAFTVNAPAGDNLLFHKALDMAQPGDVIVLANKGSMSRALCGEIMSNYAKSRGIAGIIIDGCVRDSYTLSQMDFPVYAKGITPNGPYKNGPGEMNFPVSFAGIVITVSHDRYFLDNICTRIWEVSFQTMTTYKGNFSAYLPQKEAADALRQKQHDADVALAEKLQDYVDRNLVRASTTKMAQSRRKQLEKLEITEAPKDETNQLKFRFEYDVEPWNELVLLKNLTIKIGERTLLEPFTYTVCRGQRLVIAGPNGAGKSTLMQVLDGKRRPSGGMVRLGTGARPSIFAQQQNRLGQGRVIDVIWNKYPRMTELEVRNHLAKLGFRGETVFKPCEALSGGELARLRFAEIVLERPNLLFLDEPTNHLDIYTRENLTEALMAYTGTLLMVTHDRHLMNSLGCPILYLEDGKATLYPSYDALMGRAAPAAAPEKAGDQPAKAGYGKEQRRRRAELRAKIKACEDEMEACGAREVELDNEINSPEVYNDPDLLRQKSDELSDLRFHQEELFAAWEKAMEEQEQYEQAADEE